MKDTRCPHEGSQEVMQGRKEDGDRYGLEHEIPVLRGRQFIPEAMA